MKCPNCGTEVADGIKFCTECGNPLAAAAVQEAEPGVAVEAASAAETAPLEVDSAAETEVISEPVAAQETAVIAEPVAEGPTAVIAESTVQQAPYTPDPTVQMPPTGAPLPGSAPAPMPGQVPPGAPYQAPAPVAKSPWYGKTWVIILFLLFLWPVGLVLMWKKSCDWKKPVKIVITVLCGLYFIFAIWNIVSTAQMVEDITTSSTSAGALTQPSDSKSTESAEKGSTAKSTGSSSKGSTSGSSTGGSSSNKGATASATEFYDGVPTVTAIITLTGKQVSELCLSNGMSWESDVSYYLGHAKSGKAVNFEVVDGTDTSLQQKEIEGYGNFATSNKPMKASIICAPADFDESVHAYLKGVEADASAVNPDGQESLFLVRDESGNAVIVDAMFLPDSGRPTFDVYNDAYVAGGYAGNWLTGGKTGMTCSQAFNWFATEGIGKTWRVAG